MSETRINCLFQSLFDPDTFNYKNKYTQSIASRIFKCRKADLGYHAYRCNNKNCGHTHVQYHSCGNRHCPFCGMIKKDEWVEDRITDLLPCPYYHVVFTVPHEWNKIMLQNPRELYKILFDAASETLLTLGNNDKYLGATPGVTNVLHTWGQTLDYHVHLHCIVSGGGIKKGKWIEPKRINGKFLFPITVLKKVYKGIFLKLVRERKDQIAVEETQIDQAIEVSGKKKWKVYAKQPFGGPEQVVRYLGRYTHKTAISHYRVKSVDKNNIYFNYKDYRDGKIKEMTLTHREFMSRFERHILPYRFVRIRHYGLLKNQGKVERLKKLREEMDWGASPPKVVVSTTIRMLEKYGVNVGKCTKCNKGYYELVLTKRFGEITYYKPRDVPLEA